MSSAASCFAGDSTGTAHDFVPDIPFITAREELFDKIVAVCPIGRGKELSASDREKLGLRASTLVYGEIKFKPFAIALQKLRDLYGGLDKPGLKFYDLGSGTGKAVFAAALLHPWETCTGIEILDSLHAASLELLDRWEADETQDSLPEDAQGVHIDFVQGDLTKVTDWTEADVLFLNSTCFDEELMRSIAAASASMKVGSFAISFTKRLPSEKWSILESTLEQMSWGGATVFIHQKVLA